MTVLTQPHPGDTGEIRTGDRTRAIRVPADLRPSPPNADGATCRIKPPTVLVPLVPRRPPVNPTADTGLIGLPAVPTGAELAVAARADFTTSPTAPPRPLPPPPKPTKGIAAAQAPGYVGRHRTVEPAPAVGPPPGPVLDVEPTRVWPNLIPRLIDLLTLRGAR